MLSNVLSDLEGTKARLVAVSKMKSTEDILRIYEQGHRIFGENRVQELKQKHSELPKDIEWHFIGHLQTNKVKQIAPFIHLIHSVDSVRLLKEINKQGAKNDRIIDVLLQFKIAQEVTKHGLQGEEMFDFLQKSGLETLHNVRIKGVMGMGSFTDNHDQVRKEFKNLVVIFNRLKERFFVGDDNFFELSMGMSGDYKIALEEGSTLVRIGSLIFGQRYY